MHKYYNRNLIWFCKNQETLTILCDEQLTSTMAIRQHIIIIVFIFYKHKQQYKFNLIL